MFVDVDVGDGGAVVAGVVDEYGVKEVEDDEEVERFE